MLCNAHRPARCCPAPCRQRSRPLQAFANPYKVLQISEDSDPSQIKRAYRKLALKHHPDISDHPSAEEDFVKIQQAYEVLTKNREAAQADPARKGWDFHDWYWDFMSSSRWNRQWKQHGQSGPSPFAATPSHRDQWHAQLGRLKQKAAFRKAKQKAQQEAQTAEHEPSQHRTTDNAAHQSHTADGVHFQGEQQSSMQDRESSQGHSAAANNVSSMNIRQSEAQHQAVHDAEFHQQSDPQSSPSWPTVSGQHSGNVDHNHAKGEILTAPSGDDHEGTQPVTAGHGSTQHHNTGKQDGGEAAVVHTMPIAHVQVHENADPVPLTVMPHMGAMVSHSADGSSACPVENIGPASYSHVVEEVSMTPSERVQSQLIGLRRRAARKA